MYFSQLTPKLLQVNKYEVNSIPAGMLAMWPRCHSNLMIPIDLLSMRASLLEQALKAKDIYIPHVRLHEHTIFRKTLSLVLLNHIFK